MPLLFLILSILSILEVAKQGFSPKQLFKGRKFPKNRKMFQETKTKQIKTKSLRLGKATESMVTKYKTGFLHKTQI